MSTLINGTVLSDEIILNKQTSTLTLDTDNKYVDKDIQFYLIVQSGTAGAGSIEADVDVQSGGANNISSVIGTKSTTQPSGYYIKLEASGSGSPTISTAGWIDAGSMTPATATTVKYFPIAAASVIQNTPTIDEATGLVSATTTTSAGYTPALTTAASTLQLSTQEGKTVTPTESQQTAVAAGKYTTGNVLVGAISPSYVGSAIPKNSTSSLVIEGDTVTAPAGYYATDASGSVSAGSVKSGSANISSVSVAYDSTNDDFDITGTGNVSAPSVTAAGYISSSKGTKAANNGGASVNASVSKIAGTTGITGTFTYTPTISKQNTPSGVTNAASGNATTTAPSSGVYVAVKATGGTNQITATPSISTAGYGEASHHGIINGTANVGASDSDVAYVPITTTSASVSGRTVSYGTGWITGGNKQVALGTVTSGSATISSASYEYDTTNGNFNVSGNASIAAPFVDTAGYVSNTEGTKNGNTARLATTVDKIAGSVSVSGTKMYTPTITKQSVPSGVTNAASGNATTTAPSSGVYVAVKSAEASGNVTASASISTSGYGTSSYHGIAGSGNVKVGANASSMTYVPITTTSASVSGKNVTYGTGWITGDTKSVADGTTDYAVSSLPSGATSSGTINRGKYIKVGQGWHENEYYLAQSNSGDKTISSAGTTNVDGYATATVAAGTVKATVSSNTAGSASMSATGITPLVDGTSDYYVTLTTSPGSVKAKAAGNAAGYITSSTTNETSATSVAVNGNGNVMYLPTTGVTASVSSNTSGAASMAATGFTPLSSGTSSYYVTLSTTAGKVKAKAVGNGIGIVTSSTTNETGETNVSVSGNGNKIYIPAADVTTSFTGDGMSTYFNSGTSSDKNVTITPKYVNSAGYKPATSSATNNGGTAYYKIKTTSATVNGKSVSYGTGWIAADTKSVADGAISASVSSNLAGSASMAATGFTPLSGSSTSSYYVTLSTSPGSVKAAATVGTEGYVTSDNDTETSATSVAVSGNGNKMYIPTTTVKASVSSNSNGSASMAASGFTASSSATSYYVTLSTSPGSVKAKAVGNGTGIITSSTSNETGATSVAVNGNGNKLYIPASNPSEGTTTVSGSTATRGEWSQSAGYTPSRTISAATFANSATSNTTYVDISGTGAAPVLAQGDYLYINKGWTDNLKISLAKLVPDGSDVKGHGDYILAGHSAYDNDGILVGGTIQDGVITNSTTLPSGASSSGTITRGKYIKISSGYYSSDKYYLAQNVSNGTITNNTTLPSGTSSSGTVNRGSYIKIGAGYYSADAYYLAQANSGNKSISASGSTNVDGFATVSVPDVSGSIGGTAAGGSATAAITNTNSMATITDLSGKTAGTDYWQVKATATGTAGGYTPKYTVSTAGWIASTVTGTKQTVSVSSDSTGKSIYIPKAAIAGSSTNATATTTVAPGTVSVSKQGVPSGVTQAASGDATTTAPTSGVYVAVKATAAANTTGTTSAISGSGSATVSTAGYAPSTLTGTVSVSGTATAKTSAKDSSVTYVPITTATPAFDGGTLSGGSTATGTNVTLSTTDNGMKVQTAYTAASTAVLYNGAVNGWVSKADNAQALAAQNKASTNGTAYYVTAVTMPKDKGFTVTTTADTALDTTSDLDVTNNAYRRVDITNKANGTVLVANSGTTSVTSGSATAGTLTVNAYDNASTPALTGAQTIVSNGKWSMPTVNASGTYYGRVTVGAGTVSASVSSNTAGSASVAATGFTASSSATSYYVTLSTTAGSVKAKAAGGTAGYVTSSTTNETAATSVAVSGNGTKLYIPTTGVTASVSSNTAGSASMAATGFTASSSATSYYVTLSTSAGSVKAKAVGNGTGIVTSSTSNETAATSVAVSGNGNKLYIPAAAPTFKGGAVSGTATASSSTGATLSSTNNSGITVVAAASATRAKVQYNAAVNGYLSKAASADAYAAGSATALTSTTYYLNGVTMATPSSGSRTFTVTAPSGGTNHTYTFTQGADGRTTIKVDNTLTMAWNATDESLDFIYT